MARIAVIGAGNIGGTLGDAWRHAGHQVTFGVRDPGERTEGDRAFATPEEAIGPAEVVVFAVPGASMEETVRDLGRSLRGKVIVDATNRVGAPIPHAEALASISSSETPVFRAFNSLGWENFKDPHYGSDVADLFFAGQDGPGRPVIEGLIKDVGLRPIYVGTDFDLVDDVLRLWMALVRGQGMGRALAFKVLTR